MSVGSFEAARPLSSGEFNSADPDRYDDVEKKHQRLCDFLKARQYDAFLIQRPANFAWFTSGGVCPQSEPGDANAALFITSDARLVACNNLDSGGAVQTTGRTGISGQGASLARRTRRVAHGFVSRSNS